MKANQRVLTSVTSVWRSPRITADGDKPFFESIVYGKPMEIAKKVRDKIKSVTSTAPENAQEASKSEDTQKEWDDAKEGMESTVKKSKHQYLNAARDSAYDKKKEKDIAPKEAKEKEERNKHRGATTDDKARKDKDSEKNPPRPNLTNQPK